MTDEKPDPQTSLQTVHMTLLAAARAAAAATNRYELCPFRADVIASDGDAVEPFTLHLAMPDGFWVAVRWTLSLRDGPWFAVAIDCDFTTVQGVFPMSREKALLMLYIRDCARDIQNAMALLLPWRASESDQ